jgi:hypothetical protein
MKKLNTSEKKYVNHHYIPTLLAIMKWLTSGAHRLKTNSIAPLAEERTR